MLPWVWPYTVPSHLLVPLQSTCIICLHHLSPSLLSAFIVSPFISIISPVIFPVISPCYRCLPLSLSPLSLSIPMGGDVAVSTCSALRVNAHSGGGQVLGCHHRCLLPPLSLTTHPPCKLGLTAVVVSPCPWLEVGGVLSVTVMGPWSWWSCTPIAPPVHRTSSGSWQWLCVLVLLVPFHPTSSCL